jgi:adenylyltransferase/sulfurtransferase
LDKKISHLLIDCRPQLQQDICKVNHAISIPLADIQKEDGLKLVKELVKKNNVSEIYVMCRKGNASQIAVRYLKDHIDELERDDIEIKDIIGGIEAWSTEIDQSIPLY